VVAPSVYGSKRADSRRFVGRMSTAKDRSNIAFQAGQSAWGGRVDNRITIDPHGTLAHFFDVF